MKKRNPSAYIHIPFCKQKCHYCSFTSYSSPKRDYVSLLRKEINFFYKGEKLSSLYIGGGTPSLLSQEEFEAIINTFNLEENAEITVELNPESTTFELLEKLAKLGVNRLSIGVQSFDDNILKSIGRLHNAQEAKKAIRLTKEAGFKNISIDLMYGLPKQTLEQWEKTLDEAIEIKTEHISLYGLKIEEGSYFYKNPPQELPNADLQADMYLSAVEKLKNFKHYEISNFAKNEGFKSKHNLGYWELVPYYGFGVGASGYIDGKRYTNTCSLEDYFKNPTEKKDYEQTDAFEEEIFLGFRKLEGIDVKYLNSKYGVDFEKKYEKVINKYPGHILKTKNGYRLSVEGILLSNVVLSDFL